MSALGAGEMASLIKCLPYKYQDLSVTPKAKIKTRRKISAGLLLLPIPALGRWGSQGLCDPASLAYFVDSRSIKDLVPIN